MATVWSRTVATSEAPRARSEQAVRRRQQPEAQRARVAAVVPSEHADPPGEADQRGVRRPRRRESAARSWPSRGSGTSAAGEGDQGHHERGNQQRGHGGGPDPPGTFVACRRRRAGRAGIGAAVGVHPASSCSHPISDSPLDVLGDLGVLGRESARGHRRHRRSIGVGGRSPIRSRAPRSRASSRPCPPARRSPRLSAPPWTRLRDLPTSRPGRRPTIGVRRLASTRLGTYRSRVWPSSPCMGAHASRCGPVSNCESGAPMRRLMLTFPSVALRAGDASHRDIPRTCIRAGQSPGPRRPSTRWPARRSPAS
jgi:hypothetical protein